MAWGLGGDALMGQGQHRFRSFEQEDGLSGNSIRDLLEDRKGFIWIATDNGLDRFDGRNFLNLRFDPKNPNSLSSDRVNRLAIDEAGQLWIGTANGLCQLDLNSGAIERIKLGEDESKGTAYDIQKVLVDRSGNIWVGTLSSGLFKLSPNPSGEGYSLKQYIPGGKGNGLSSPTIKGLLQVDREYLWIGTREGVDRLHLPSETFVSILSVNPVINIDGVSNLFEDQDGNIVYSIAKEGMFFIDPKVMPLTSRPFLSDELSEALPSGQAYRNVIQDRQGQFWIGFRGGVYLLDAAKEHYEFLRYSTKPRGGVRALLESRDGTIWVGFSTAGISRKSRRVSLYHPIESDRGGEHVRRRIWR